MGSTNVWDTINAGIASASNILSARYSVPQLNPGQYIQNKQGVMYQLGDGGSPFGFPGASSLGGTSTTTLLMIAGVGIVVLMFVSKR